MATIVAISDTGVIEETFVVAEPVGLVVDIITKLVNKMKVTQPTFGMDSWSIALELKTSMALISENESKDKDFDVLYDVGTGELVSV